MTFRDTRVKTKHFGDLHPEFVFLGLLIEEPSHGYELYKRFNNSLSCLWRLSESQMYSILKRLETHGFIESSDLPKISTGSKKVFSPTLRGKELFNEWLIEPSVCSPRVLRLEFLTRLYFAKKNLPQRVTDIFTQQYALVSDTLRKVQKNKDTVENGFTIAALAQKFSERQLLSAILWLDEEVRPILI